MEFLKLDKERENPPEELQSMSVSVCWYSLCVREHVPVHTSILAPLHPTHPHTHPLTLTDIVDFTGMVSTWISYDCCINLEQLEVSQSDYVCYAPIGDVCGLIGVKPTVTNQVHPHETIVLLDGSYILPSLLISVSGIQILCQSC